VNWSIKLARIAGIDIKIHLTFVLLLAWIGFTYYLQGGIAAAFQGVLFILLIFTCVLLHEFGHALAARRYGIATPDITLLPIGGVARLQRIPDRPRQELVVALAGPLVDDKARLVGLITPENVGEMMMVRSALGKKAKAPAGQL
jgi:Zn-dependent protease